MTIPAWLFLSALALAAVFAFLWVLADYELRGLRQEADELRTWKKLWLKGKIPPGDSQK